MALNHVSDIARAVDLQLKSDSAPTPERTRELYRAMIALAERCIELGHTQTGADILAFLLLQNHLDPDAEDQAEELFAELESRVCPRIMLDAREFAAGMDLSTMLEYLLNVAPRERI